MKYGCCVNILPKSGPKTGIEYVQKLKDIGYDYVELPLNELSKLSNAEFDSPQGRSGGGDTGGALSKYGRDLTELAKNNKIDPVIGRQQEIERVIQILSRRTTNNQQLKPGLPDSECRIFPETGL